MLRHRLNARSDWQPVSGGGEVGVYKITYEQNAYVSYGESLRHKLIRSLPWSLQSRLNRLAGPGPAEWWAIAQKPLFTVWLVARNSANRAPASLEKVLLVLPDGQEIPGHLPGFNTGTKDALRSYYFDPAYRALPRLHLRAFVKEQSEPLEFDILNPLHDPAL
ncbi:MAG: hypothetical protein JWL59_2111 [Chthoniobacteraceae bacterium]|nr:hypothetical protein [Chthoniobacteraceae bacterium]